MQTHHSRKSGSARIRYDAKSFIVGGQRVLLVGGEFHYFRTPHELWEDRLIKMKRAGANFVATYIPWNWHEPVEGQERWTGDCDLAGFLELCARHGLYVVIKPGPYICAEWDFGGYPDWILGKGIPLRVLDERHMRYVDRWYRRVAEVIRPYLITNGGNILCVQVENEYDHLMRLGTEPISVQDARTYFMRLAGMMDRYGLNVPKFANEAEFLHGLGIIDTRTYYPNIPWIWMWNFRYFDDKIRHARRGQPDCPTMILELQSGWFGQFGQPEYVPDVNLTEGVSKSVLMLGASLLNFYMFVGGTTFPFWGCRGDRSAHPVGQLESWAKPIGNITSYDFGGSAVREWGELMPGRYDYLRAFAQFTHDFQDLLVRAAETQAVGVLSGGEGVLRVGPAGVDRDVGLASEPENFTVLARRLGRQHLVLVRNLDERPKTVTVGWKKNRQPIFRGLRVGAHEARLLPVNVQIPGTDVRIVRSTSELLFARKTDGAAYFGLYGKPEHPGETVLDVPASQVKVLAGRVQVRGDRQAVLRYAHRGLHVVQVGHHRLVILERSLAGKVDELPHGLLVWDAYFVRDLEGGRGELKVGASLRRGSANAFYYIGSKTLARASAAGRPLRVERRGAVACVRYRAPSGRPVRLTWEGEWKARLDTAEALPDYNDEKWSVLRGPVPLEKAGFLRHGYVWYRTEFDLPAGARDVSLAYTGNDVDRQHIFVNGKRVWDGITGGCTIGIDHAVRPGRNVLAVLYANFFHNKAHPSEGPIMKYSGIMAPVLVQGRVRGRSFRRTLAAFRVREGLTGDLQGYADSAFDDSRWISVPAGRKYVTEREAGLLIWWRRKFRMEWEPGWSAAVRLTIPDAHDRCLLFVNGKPLGRFEQVGPQHQFYVPETFLRSENVLAILLEGIGGWFLQPKLDTYYEAKDVALTLRFR